MRRIGKRLEASRPSVTEWQATMVRMLGFRTLTAPLNLVDREGLLALRLTDLPAGLTAGGGTGYLGWSVIALGLIAFWPRRRVNSEALQRTAALLILALGLFWLLRGPDSLHDQLRRIFESATVKRHVEPATLQLLGLLVMPLMAMPLLVFLAVGGVLRNRRRWTIGSVLAASVTAILWWGTSPAMLVGSASQIAAAIQGSAMSAALVTFPLVCGVAVGLERLCEGTPTRSGRVLLWPSVLVLLAADLGGPARSGLDRIARQAPAPCAARTYDEKRDDAPRLHCEAQ